jgi:hypothetical protein
MSESASPNSFKTFSVPLVGDVRAVEVGRVDSVRVHVPGGPGEPERVYNAPNGGGWVLYDSDQSSPSGDGQRFSVGPVAVHSGDVTAIEMSQLLAIEKKWELPGFFTGNLPDEPHIVEG